MNIRNQSLQNRIMLYAASTLVVIVLAGCQNGNAANTPVHNDVSESNPARSAEIAQDAENPSSRPAVSDHHADSNMSDMLHDLDKSKSAETSSMRDGLTAKSPFAELDGNAVWNTEMPRLSGISMQDTSSTVVNAYGAEKDSYMLGEASSQVKVLEYEGISIGFDKQNFVQFIEIYSDLIPAGLNGLKIGDSPEDAYTLLGQPDTQTEYLLTYSAEGAFLKLDIDPGSNQIISIKLLSAA